MLIASFTSSAACLYFSALFTFIHFLTCLLCSLFTILPGCCLLPPDISLCYYFCHYAYICLPVASYRARPREDVTSALVRPVDAQACEAATPRTPQSCIFASQCERSHFARRACFAIRAAWRAELTCLLCYKSHVAIVPQ